MKEKLVTPVDEIKDEKDSSLKIEIVKSSNNKNEERAKTFVSGFIRELLLITLFVGIAFAGKGVFYIVFVQSNQPPLVTEERQQAFKDAISKLEHQYPTGYSFGIPAAELGFGEYKYDKEVTLMSEFEDLNDFRKRALERHAEKASEIFFWILLIGIPLLRYIILLSKWLNSDASPQKSSSTQNNNYDETHC